MGFQGSRILIRDMELAGWSGVSGAGNALLHWENMPIPD